MEDNLQPEKHLSLPYTELAKVIANSSQYINTAIYFIKNLKTLDPKESETNQAIKIQNNRKNEENQQSIENSNNIIQNLNEAINNASTNQSIADVTDLNTEITSPLNITFDPSIIVKWRRVRIKNTKVKFSNLNLIGSIFMENSTLKLDNCRIHDPPPNSENPTSDYLVNCNKGSQLFAKSSEFYNSDNFGLCADDISTIHLNKCRIMNIRLFGVAITSFSSLYANETDFINISFEHVYLENQCSVTCTKCNFDTSNKHAFNCSNKSIASIEGCIIRNCKQGAIYACHCDRVVIHDTTISDLDYSAIYLDNTVAAIKRTSISKCNGNGINVAHNSKTFINQCNFENTTYPAIAVCEKSFSLIQRCEINDSMMSGLIVRTNSQATIDHCLISGSKTFGICVSDSMSVQITNTLISKSEEAGVCVYNHSHVVVKDSHIIGPSKYGFDVFCGGVVYALKTTIIGASETCIWVHHSGSGSFLKTTVDLRTLKKHDDIMASIKEIESPETDEPIDEKDENALFDLKLSNAKNINSIDLERKNDPDKKTKNDENDSQDRLIRIETARPVVFQRDLVKKMPLIIAKNHDAELPKYGLNTTPPKCKLCGKIANDCYFCICAHCVYCMECWKSLGDEKPKVCELCLMTIESVSKPINCSSDDKTCSICYENEFDSIIVPCGHTICHKCAEKWFETSSECPFCRENGSRSRRFVSYE